MGEIKNMKNKGRAQYRFRGNPSERVFALAWERVNTDRDGRLDGRGVLDYLLSEDPNFPNGEVTARDRKVAATVIQWLGSTCGRAFLFDALHEQGFRLIAKPKNL